MFCLLGRELHLDPNHSAHCVGAADKLAKVSGRLARVDSRATIRGGQLLDLRSRRVHGNIEKVLLGLECRHASDCANLGVT
jgi:hypothetical protein